MNKTYGADDVIDLVARYAPTSASLSAEWTAVRRRDALSTVLADGEHTPGAAVEIPLRFVPAGQPYRRRWARALPLAASVAVLALATGLLVAVVGSGSDRPSAGGRQTLGAPFDPPAGLSSTSIANGQYSYRVIESREIGANGQPRGKAGVLAVYYAPDGSRLPINDGSRGCIRRPSGPRSFDQPSRAFLAALPTGVAALGRYLRAHVSGSSSRDEAVFTGVGDALREADALASPRLRAAMLAVLSRTPGVTVHREAADYLGRPALRADFVDQRIRPGVVESLFFAPGTFQLLEQAEMSNGQPGRYSGPSPAYDGHGQIGVDPEQLSGPGSIEVTTTEKVVDKLPSWAQRCRS